MNILVINAGSSSLKYQLLNPDTQEVLAKGLCERIGIDGKFTYKPAGKDPIKDADVAMPTHSEAIQTVLHALVDEKNGVISSMKEIDAVGHRVVQPRQHHRHQGLPGADARHPHGGRVRHRLPPDHAPRGLHLRPALRVL